MGARKLTIVRSSCQRCGRVQDTDVKAGDGHKTEPAFVHPEWATLHLISNTEDAKPRGAVGVLYLCPYCVDEFTWWQHAPDFELSADIIERFGLDPTLRNETEQAFLGLNGASSWTFPLIIRYLLIPSHEEN